MINNDEELESTKRALDLAERTLIALKKKVYPINPQKYSILAEPYLEYIVRMRSEKDEYIGLAAAEEQAIPIWIRLKGPHIQEGSVPIEVLSKFLNNFKMGVQRVAEFIETETIRESGRPTEDIRRLCNFRTKILPGSIRIGLTYPTSDRQANISGEVIKNPVETAVEKLLVGASWSGGSESREIEEIFPDEKERYLILTQVENYIPKEEGEISSVEFNGSVLNERTITLIPRSRIKIKEALERTIPTERITAEGTIREIDLDKQRFYLREMTNGMGEIPCNYPVSLQDDAKDGLDNKVKILGELIKDKVGKPINITVERIDVLGITGH
jgi:hypothetical protein